MTASIARKIAAFAFAGALAATTLGLVGCSQSGSSADADRIAELEREVDELKAQQAGTQDQGSSTDASNSQQGTATDSSTAATQQQSTTQTTEFADATVADFSARADELIAEADAATPPADRSELIQMYFDYDSRFEALEHEIDLYDDQKELEYRNGAITFEQYRQIDIQLDTIEHKMDVSIESLEWRFGVDD